jgi:DNA-binding LacI/PurR family transcriptional regulator
MTVHQIAKLAKVSTATVSRVLNGTGTVKPETAEVVRRIIDQHGNPANQLLVRRGPRQGSRRSAKPRAPVGTTIAIVSVGQAHGPWFEMPVMAKVISGITREAKERGLVVQIEEGNSPDELGVALRSRGVGGVLTFLPSTSDPNMLRALARHLPVVRVMGEATGTEGIDHVGPDNVAIGAMALEYLMAEGCRDVAFLTANPGWDLIHMRGFGFQTRAIQLGMTPAPVAFIVPKTDADRERYGVRAIAQPTLEAAIDAFVKASPRPAGLFVPRDEETVAVYRLLAARGVVPGRDLTVVSCDNEDMRLSALHPRPASIELGTMEIGRQAVRRLLSRMRRPHEPAIKIQAAPRLAMPAESSVHGVLDVSQAAADF